jgi:Domain of unknown function (DUF5615)
VGWENLNFSADEMAGQVKSALQKARFYLDEPLGPEVRHELLRQGYKVITAQEVSMVGRADEDHAALCWRRGKILVTADRDFLDPKKLPDHRNPGVVVLGPGVGGDAVKRAAYFVGVLVGPFAREWRGRRLLVQSSGEVTIWSRKGTGVVTSTRYRFTRHGPSQRWVE